jgi:hypothetical protein
MCGGTFTNGCVLCMEVVQSIGAPLHARFGELRLQEGKKRDSYSEGMAT